MRTNKELFKCAIIKANNYKIVFQRYRLSVIEIQKLYRYLKPLYMYFEDNHIIFKFPNPRRLDSLIDNNK